MRRNSFDWRSDARCCAAGGNGGATSGGSSATGGTVAIASGGSLGSGGQATTPDCSSLVTTLNCVSDADCCVVATSCKTALWLVTKSEQASLAACASTPTSMCPACMAPQVEVACTGGKCVGTKVGDAWPPSGLSAPHCGKLTVGSGGNSASAAVPVPAFSPTGGSVGTGGARAVTKFGC